MALPLLLQEWRNCTIFDKKNRRRHSLRQTGGKHMQLVKSSIHNANKPHLGGATLASEGLKGVFPYVDLAKKFKCK